MENGDFSLSRTLRYLISLEFVWFSAASGLRHANDVFPQYFCSIANHLCTMFAMFYPEILPEGYFRVAANG